MWKWWRSPGQRPAGKIALWIKLVHTAIAAIVVPVYVIHYCPAHLLWFSDVALIVLVAAVWLESRLLASMMALAVLLPEVAWNLDFFAGLLVGGPIIGLAGYMFEAERPLWLRGLSLFHVELPILLVWLMVRLGYDRRALAYQTLLAWAVLPASYLLNTPSENVNYVHGVGDVPQQVMHPLLYLLLVMLVIPLGIYLPTHWLLTRLFAGDPT